MQPNDKKRFLTILTGVADYYGKELAVATLGLYWDGLRQYDLDAVEKAMRAHVQNPDTGQWMPKIADITKMMEGRTTDQAALAWSKVDAAVRRVGTWSDVVFDDALIHRVLADMGGWLALAMKTEQDWPFLAREFENRYRGFRMRGEMPEYPPVLIGAANAHNGKEGLRGQPPVLIGDSRMAQAVLAAGTTNALITMQSAGELVAPVGAPRLTNGRAA